MEKKPLGIYLHFPFCARKCRYCDFLSAPADEDTRIAYAERLREEIALRASQLAGESYEVRTVFFGGGTPSLMSGSQVQYLMDDLTRAFDMAREPEITLECNPGTVDAAKLEAFRRAGVNRLSFGLQSMNDDELAFLGRIHRASDFLESFSLARACGFDNINIDLMSALPGQSVGSWERTIEKTAALEPEHISAYSLIIEPGTPFAALYGDDVPEGERPDNVPPLPDEESDREMYRLTEQILNARGYHRYEISNYARDGRECRHNLIYWTMDDYLGLGLGASGKLGGRRLQNTSDLHHYMEAFETEVTEVMTRKAQMEETMFLGLRLMRGVSLARFEQTFGCSLQSVYGDVIRRWQRSGHLKIADPADPHLRLTPEGIDISNLIMAEFLIE